MNKNIKILFNNLAIFSLLIQQLTLPAMVWAQTVDEPTPTPVQEQSPTVTPDQQPSQPTATPVQQEATATPQPTEIEPTSTPISPTQTPLSISPTPTPTTVSVIDSGNADSSAANNNDINNNDQIVVNPTGVGCTTEGGCVIIEASKEASVSAETNSSSDTGNNQISGASGDALITSGEASAGASNQNQINTTQIPIENGSTEPMSISPVNVVPIIVVENSNGVDLGTSTSSSANSGENGANNNGGNATINSGDVIAYANVINMLNTNIVGGKFKILLMNNLMGQTGDINMNDWWKEIMGDGTSETMMINSVNGDNSNFIYVGNINWANLNNQVSVIANSGYNMANFNAGGAYIYSGNATALANVINLVNTNLVGARFFLGVINIDASSLGDLIIPRKEYFDLLGQVSEDQKLTMTSQNMALVDSLSMATAETGNNQSSGGAGDIITGDANARSNSLLVTSLNSNNSNQMFLGLNTLGNWTGKIYNWREPGSIEDPINGDTNYFITGAEGGIGGDGGMWVNNDNNALVGNQMLVSANTGYNQALGNGGSSNIFTGKARALANLTNFINLNLWGSNWFYGLVNIVGDWKGNMIVAYPDMSVKINSLQSEVKVGDNVQYQVKFDNLGYDEAENVNIQLNLPAGVVYIEDSSGVKPAVSGNSIIWTISKVKAKTGGGFQVWVEVTEDFAKDSQANGFRLVPIAFAAEKEKDLVAEVIIKSQKVESNTGSKRSYASTKVVIDSQNGNTVVTNNATAISLSENTNNNPLTNANDDGIDHRQPLIKIFATNNVNDFVYPKDIVKFEVKVSNVSDAPAENCVLLHQTYDGEGNLLQTDRLNIGKIGANKKGNIFYGIALKNNMEKETQATAKIQVLGKAVDGSEIASNTTENNYLIKIGEEKILGSGTEVAAAENEGQIVGNFVENICSPKENIFPFILLFGISSIWLMRKTNDWIAMLKKKNEKDN